MRLRNVAVAVAISLPAVGLEAAPWLTAMARSRRSPSASPPVPPFLEEPLEAS